MSKWNEETEATLVSLAGEGQVSQDTLKSISETMGAEAFTTRSIGSKLRKMAYDVQKVGERASKYSPEQEDEIKAFLAVNHGDFTYAEIAKEVCDGNFSAKEVQGKILSMELTACVKPAPKKESQKTYSDAEEAIVLKGCKAGDFLETIAKAVNKSLASTRGKALSLLKTGAIDAMPVQENKKGSVADPIESIDVATQTVAQIAEALGKTERGVKTMLTNRKLSASDYTFKVKTAK